MLEEKKVDYVKWLGIIATLASLGLFGFIETQLDSIVNTRVENVLKDTNNVAVKALVHRVTQQAKQAAKQELQNKALVMEVAEAFSGFRGLNTPELVNYLGKRFDLADSIAEVMPGIQANHEFINKLREASGDGKNAIQIIGEGKPETIITTDGVRRKIYEGSPALKPRKIFYYYRDDKDEPVPIYFITPN